MEILGRGCGCYIPKIPQCGGFAAKAKIEKSLLVVEAILAVDYLNKFQNTLLIDNQLLYHDYVFGKQTLKQLSTKYKVSVSTVQRKLDCVRSTRFISSEKSVVVLMDTVYWGRNFGVVVMKDSRTGKISLA